MPRPSGVNTTLRIPDQAMLDRIDAAAARAGLSRTGYILSWIPEADPVTALADQVRHNRAAAQRKRWAREHAARHSHVA
jgi:hypothetical protein